MSSHHSFFSISIRRSLPQLQITIVLSVAPQNSFSKLQLRNHLKSQLGLCSSHSTYQHLSRSTLLSELTQTLQYLRSCPVEESSGQLHCHLSFCHIPKKGSHFLFQKYTGISGSLFMLSPLPGKLSFLRLCHRLLKMSVQTFLFPNALFCHFPQQNCSQRTLVFSS